MKEHKTEFQRQLQDPRWQKKRLEIMDRDEWTCKGCGDTKATLTVHHKSYNVSNGRFVDVWCYDNSDLITLCDSCHAHEELALKKYAKELPIKYRGLCENAESIYGLFLVAEELHKRKGSRLNIHDIGKLYSIAEVVEI